MHDKFLLYTKNEIKENIYKIYHTFTSKNIRNNWISSAFLIESSELTSNTFNFLISGQKNNLKVFIFIIGSQVTFWY